MKGEIEDFVNEVIMALKERHDELSAGLIRGTGVSDYAQYREMVGSCRAYEGSADLVREIASRWNNG